MNGSPVSSCDAATCRPHPHFCIEMPTLVIAGLMCVYAICMFMDDKHLEHRRERKPDNAPHVFWGKGHW